MSIDRHVRLTPNLVLHRHIQDEAFLKRMIRSSWKAYSQIYTRGIEKEKELALSCHCAPSSARQQTAVLRAI